MIFGSDKRKGQNSANWQNMVMSGKKIVVAKHGMKEVEAGTILLGIDKNNVIADKVLSYFECLSSSLKYILLISGLL